MYIAVEILGLRVSEGWVEWSLNQEVFIESRWYWIQRAKYISRSWIRRAYVTKTSWHDNLSCEWNIYFPLFGYPYSSSIRREMKEEKDLYVNWTRPRFHIEAWGRMSISLWTESATSASSMQELKDEIMKIWMKKRNLIDSKRFLAN